MGLVLAIGLMMPARPARAQAPTSTPPPAAGGSGGTATGIGVAVTQVTQASAESPFGPAQGGHELVDLGCNDPFPWAIGPVQNIACNETIVFVPGYARDGESRDCEQYFAGIIEEFQNWGYSRSQMRTVGLDHGDVCDVAVGDYGAEQYEQDSLGTVRLVNLHAFAGGAPTNHEWVGGTDCQHLPGPDDWHFTPSHCWGHTKDTGIEHLAYHFGHYLDGFDFPVDVVAHSMGGLITQAAHSFAEQQAELPGGIYRPYKPVNGRYADIVTSGTPFLGINFLRFENSGPPGFDWDFCNLKFLSKDGWRGRPGQCKQLRAGSPFMKTMKRYMSADSGGGRWSVIGSNAFGTESDIPIEYPSAVGHPTNSKYIFHKPGTIDPFSSAFHVTHVTYAPSHDADGYYDYKEDTCSGGLRTIWIHVRPMDWPDCWDAGLWKSNGIGFVFLPPGGPPEALCDHAGGHPPNRMTGLWCHDVLSPRHNRTAFFAVTTEFW
jgi:hypothetical protein